MLKEAGPAGASAPGDYVPETAFGAWFQRSDIWRRYVVREAVADLAALLPPGSGPFSSALDIGCGTGVALDMLQQFGVRSILGIDIDAASIEHARHAARLSGGDIEVRLADAARLPLADAAFDLVFCHQLLHHANHPDAVLRECRRVLRPGGWLLVAESCHAFLAWWPVRLLFRHPPRPQQSAEEYLALVRDCGFTVDAAGFQTPRPWWSLRDLGLRRRWGIAEARSAATQVRIAARAA
ncbi:MAG: class I SAM-dependent methyltransferase [Gammaproteobacteria bacterium]|nr:class I SAM-dependent methyltransferase [Gammaproteobacteria bacterium]